LGDRTDLVSPPIVSPMGTGGTIGLIGFGRFGRAFTDLLTDAGRRVIATDPESEIPPEFATEGIEDLTSRSSTIVISTPIRLIGSALEHLAPHLTPEHTVFDVGSVKVRPSEEMRELLGTRVPWAATHPLFGPMNVARGDRSLRAIVCPNPHHPDAVAAARSLYEGIGCEVIEQTAEQHDRIMARTHAIAHRHGRG
jgi:prephenate dehydrogenase